MNFQFCDGRVRNCGGKIGFLGRRGQSPRSRKGAFTVYRIANIFQKRLKSKKTKTILT